MRSWTKKQAISSAIHPTATPFLSPSWVGYAGKKRVSLTPSARLTLPTISSLSLWGNLLKKKGRESLQENQTKHWVCREKGLASRSASGCQPCVALGNRLLHRPRKDQSEGGARVEGGWACFTQVEWTPWMKQALSPAKGTGCQERRPRLWETGGPQPGQAALVAGLEEVWFWEKGKGSALSQNWVWSFKLDDTNLDF